jgi:hypothetical protein
MLYVILNDHIGL